MVYDRSEGYFPKKKEMYGTDWMIVTLFINDAQGRDFEYWKLQITLDKESYTMIAQTHAHKHIRFEQQVHPPCRMHCYQSVQRQQAEEMG